MRKNIFIILFFCLLFVYVIFFPKRLSRELFFLPSWGLDSGTRNENLYSDNAVPFQLDNGFGYFSPSGQMLYREDVYYGAAVSDDCFINYSAGAGALVLQEQNGDISAVIENEGYPFFAGGRLFVISADRMTVTEYDDRGNELIMLSPGSAVTSLDASGELLVLCMLNGEVSVYSDSVEPLYSYFSTDSRYTIAYAAALSEDGTRFAAVTGLYPQQLVCFEYRNEEFIPVFRMNMQDELRRSMILEYSSDGKLLYVESPDGLDVFSTATFLKQDMEFGGILTSSRFSGVHELSYIMASAEDENLLRVYRPDLGRIADFYFPEGDIYFNPDDRCFYVGVDGKIFRYDMIEG